MSNVGDKEVAESNTAPKEHNEQINNVPGSPASRPKNGSMTSSVKNESDHEMLNVIYDEMKMKI